MSEQPRRLAEIVGDNIRRIRQTHGWSAQHVADLTTGRPVEFSRAGLDRIERGQRDSVTIDELVTLADVLHVSPLSLITPDDDDAPVELPLPLLSESGAEESYPRVVRAFELRTWFTGKAALPGTPPEAFEDYVLNEPVWAIEAWLRQGNEQVLRFVVDNLERLPDIDIDLVIEKAHEAFRINPAIGEEAGPFQAWLYDKWQRGRLPEQEREG